MRIIGAGAQKVPLSVNSEIDGIFLRSCAFIRVSWSIFDITITRAMFKMTLLLPIWVARIKLLRVYNAIIALAARDSFIARHCQQSHKFFKRDSFIRFPEYSPPITA